MMKREMLQFKARSIQQDVCSVTRNTLNRKYITFMTMLFVLVICVVPVFANGGIFDDMATQLEEAYNSFVPVVNICALILGAVGGLIYMFSSDEKSAGMAKKWIIRIVFAWIIISVFPYLLIQGRNLLGDSAKGQSLNDIKTIKPGS